jgi:hypothetical protein
MKNQPGLEQYQCVGEQVEETAVIMHQLSALLHSLPASLQAWTSIH